MKKILLGIALVSASTSAFADALLYGGASAGNAHYKGADGIAYNINIGTGILPFVGIEGGLTKFDSLDTAPGDKTEATTGYLAVKPSIDIGPLQIWAKGGLHAWDEKVNDAKVDDGVDIMYGVGADYYAAGPITFGASYVNYVMDSHDMGTLMVTASFHFM